jgi:integrase
MKQSIASLYELYLKRADLRPNSVEVKKRSLKYFLEWFGDMPPDKVTLAMAEDYRSLLAKGRSKRSANTYLANFKPFFTWLFRHGRIPGNPFDSIRLYKITAVRRETFSSDELSRLMQVSNRLQRTQNCLGLLGMRRGEMLNLRRDNITLTARKSRIFLCECKATKDTWPWDIKDHAARYVAIPEAMAFPDIVVNLHADLEYLMSQTWPYVCLPQESYSKIVKSWRENMLRDNRLAHYERNFQRKFRRLQKLAGITELRRFHELRAAFITQMIENTDLSRAADAVGHSNISTTKIYHRYSDMSLVEEMSRVAAKCYGTNVL